MELLIIGIFLIAVVATVIYVNRKNASKKSDNVSAYNPPYTDESGGGKKPEELIND